MAKKTIPKMNFTQFKKFFLDTMDTVDPKGLNRKYYEEKFKTMSEPEFMKMIKTPGFKWRLYMDEFHNELDYENILKACDDVGGVYQEKFIIDRKNGTLSHHTYPSFKMIITRLQQKSSTESSSSADTERRNSMGQVVDDSKSAQFSKPELAAAISTNRFKETEEMLKVRSGGEGMKRQVYNQIINEGTATMDDKEYDIDDRKEINKLKNNYLIMNLKIVE